MTVNRQFKVVLWLFAVITVVELINMITGRMMNQFANVPREVYGLPGIILSPFLHGGTFHYLSNIIPLSIFSFLMLQHGTRAYLLATLWIVLATGTLVWLLGRDAYHVGASGVVYGYFAYLLLAGFISRKPKLIVISILVGFFYGGLIWGVLPSRPFVSWESHLFGFISGLLAAKFWAKPKLSD